MSARPQTSQHPAQDSVNSSIPRQMDQPHPMGGSQAIVQGPPNTSPFLGSTRELASNVGSTPHHFSNTRSGKAAAQNWYSDPHSRGYPMLDPRAQDAMVPPPSTFTHPPSHAPPSSACPSTASHSYSHSQSSWGHPSQGYTMTPSSQSSSAPFRSPSNPSIATQTPPSYAPHAFLPESVPQSEIDRKLAKSDPSLRSSTAIRHTPRSAPFPKVEGFDYYGKSASSAAHPGQVDTQLFSLTAPVDTPDYIDLELAAHQSTAYRSQPPINPHPTAQPASQNFLPSAASHRPPNAQAYPHVSQQHRNSAMSGSYMTSMGNNQVYSNFASQPPPPTDLPAYTDESYRYQYMQPPYGPGYAQNRPQNSAYAYPLSDGTYPQVYGSSSRETQYTSPLNSRSTPRSPPSAGSSSDSRSPRSALSALDIGSSGPPSLQRADPDEFEAMIPHKKSKHYETVDNSPMPSGPQANEAGDDTSSDTAGYWTPQS